MHSVEIFDYLVQPSPRVNSLDQPGEDENSANNNAHEQHKPNLRLFWQRKRFILHL
jgi:hypothetical protein